MFGVLYRGFYTFIIPFCAFVLQDVGIYVDVYFAKLLGVS